MPFAHRIQGLRAWEVQLYQWSDALSELLILAMVIFGPWAFGTTQEWSIGVMNMAGGMLGMLLVFKLAIRRSHGYQPARWECSIVSAGLTQALVFLTAGILVYCLVSAVNRRAQYYPELHRFDYLETYITWLPHSLDSHATWLAFWRYLGLACSFWAIRDWLLGKSRREEFVRCRGAPGQEPGALLPERFRRLLWLVALNGAVLATEGIVQRLVNSPKLLFLVTPRIHQTAATQFGPYAYRANAAQYFNLVWPVCLGFWWVLNRRAQRGHNWHHTLLVCGVLMAACPLISTSRGGALIAVGILVVAMLFLLPGQLLFTNRGLENSRERFGGNVALTLFFCAALTLGLSIGWKALKPRMAQIEEGYRGREEIYDAARRMSADYPVFGIGPGAYESVSELYRPTSKEFWPAQVHDDWLELRVTFGWLGSLLVWSALAIAVLRWFFRGGIHGGRRFMILTWLALAGCLAHARFDFPFQIHSILFLFLTWCAVLCTLSHRAEKWA